MNFCKNIIVHKAYILLLGIFFLFPCIIKGQDDTSPITKDPTTDVFDKDEIVIEGSLLENTIQNTPKSVSVITEYDIEQTPGKGVIEILSKQAGINIMSFSGHDKQSTIDLRGMGATANSNVLIVIDGIRLNAPDLSGADLSVIDMDDVEKIEIIRGAESVVYGDGAVGGVVNIYTKKGKKKPELNLQATVKSYNTTDTALNYSRTIGPVNMRINTAYYDTDGYRDNGYFNKKSAGINLSVELSKNLSASLVTSFVSDEYGLPGAVDIDNIHSEDQRTKTDYPDDFGETTDLRLTAGLEWKTESNGRITIRRGYRFRDNEYVMGYNAALGISTDEAKAYIEEDTKTFNLVYTQPYSVNALQHTFKCGLDHYRSHYIREAKSQNERHNSNTESLGAFLMNSWYFTKALNMNLGGRSNVFHGRFREDERENAGTFDNPVYVWNNGELKDKNWSNQSYDIGFIYRMDKKTNLFFSQASSFRTPNVDEFAEANEDLSPQHGYHTELGWHYENPGNFIYSVSFFQIRMENEIYYGTDETTGLPENRNYADITLRRGVEGEIKWYPTDLLYFWGNTTYLKAEFEGRGTTIPLVPEIKTTVGMEATINNRFAISITGTHVGEQFDGNDETNKEWEKLDAYSVFDSKVTYEFRKGRKLFFGINNIFNELYSTVAYSQTYYPMPTRNYYCGIRWKI